MKKNYLWTGLTLLMIAIAPPKVLADEVWSTEEYDVTYQTERNRTAIWTYGDEEKVLGTIFIDDLAGVSQDRGSYAGYWVQEKSSLKCDTFREGADGKPTYYWGRFDVNFIDPDFPSRWQADFSLCDRQETIRLNGVPRQ